MPSDPKHPDPGARERHAPEAPARHDGDLADDALEHVAGGVAPGGCWDPPPLEPEDPFEPLGGDVVW